MPRRPESIAAALDRPAGAPESWTVTSAEEGQRIDRHAAARLGVARHQVQRWIDENRLTVDGAVVRASARVHAGQSVSCHRGDPPALARPLSAEAGELREIWRDDHIFAFDKPAGLVVHPGAGRSVGTLVHRLLALDPEVARVGGPGRPGIVHRLDKDTTGVLLVARTADGYSGLSEAFAARRVEKVYLAIVYGTPSAASGTIDRPIGRDPRDRKRMAVRAQGGRRALTRWRVLGAAGGLSLLEVEIETGRTHQIRVHLKAAGHPLVGDPVYGEARWKGLRDPARGAARRFARPALHAWRVSFAHPIGGRAVALSAAPPPDMEDLWRTATGFELACALGARPSIGGQSSNSR